MKLGILKESHDNVVKARAAHAEQDGHDAIARTYAIEGALYRERGLYTEGIDCLYKSLSHSGGDQEHYKTSFILLEIGSLLIRMDQDNQALQELT